MNLLNETLKKIKPIDRVVNEQARKRINNLVKPKGSLGMLEDISIQISSITGKLIPDVTKKSIIVLSGDHGVCEEGVAAGLPIVTVVQSYNIVKGVTGVAALAKQAGAEVVVVDIGINNEMDYDKIINRKIRMGTGNIAKGPAMTREEAVKSLEVGIEIAEKEIKRGVKLLGTGEMGIGNTTPSTAILSVLGGYEPEEVTGVGANLPDDKLANKIKVIKKAIEINKPNKDDPIDVLAKVGGLEIGGMAGVMLAGAANKVPVIVDGYISTVAALIATSIEPNTKEYLICSHASKEKGASCASEILGFKPFLHLDMRLGEGSGAAIAMNVVEAAVYMNREMITFEESGINAV